MNKINFNDLCGLTQAVIEGRKTQTRRIIKKPLYADDEIEEYGIYGDEVHIVANGGVSCITVKLPYKLGEVVAVAQRYQDIFDYSNCVNPYAWEDDDKPSGWTNKMLVEAELMPHRIRMTGISVERLQDISDENCIKEGIFVNEYVGNGKKCHHYGFDGFFDETAGWFARGWYNTPREAYAALIDKISGKGAWESNPYVFVYDFELIK